MRGRPHPWRSLRKAGAEFESIDPLVEYEEVQEEEGGGTVQEGEGGGTVSLCSSLV